MSLLLLLRGSDAEAPETSTARIAVIHEFPPDELAVRIEPPGGAPTRLAADEWRPENVLDNLECSDEIPGGDKECRFTLARDPRAPQPDLATFSKGAVYGPGGEVVWGPGRLGKTSHVEGDSKSISVELEGNSTELEDNRALRLGFIDSSMERWRGMGSERKQALLKAGWKLGDGSQEADASVGTPTLKFDIEGNFPKMAVSSWFDAGPGMRIARMMWDRKSESSEPSGLSPLSAFNFYALAAERDDEFGEVGVDQHTANKDTDSQASFEPSIPRRFAYFAWEYGSANNDAYTYSSLVSNLRVLADHGLPLQGSWPQVGYTARHMLEYAITRFTGLEFDEESEDDGYIIPQAWWSDYTSLAAVVQELTRYGLLDWMVFGEKFSLCEPGTYGEKWKLYSGSSEFQEDGEDTARSWRRITVAWPDSGGTTKTAGPPGSGADYETAELEITDPDHPAVKADKDRHDVLVLKAGYKDLAIGTGVRWLVEANELSHAGSCAVSGWAQNDKGIWKPASQIRGGDLASRADSGDPSYRKVTSRAYSHSERKAQLSLDAPPGGLQALLERYDADLISLGTP